jgi:hypothetical protein
VADCNRTTDPTRAELASTVILADSVLHSQEGNLVLTTSLIGSRNEGTEANDEL